MGFRRINQGDVQHIIFTQRPILHGINAFQ